jgi:hypothetical protein
MLVILNLILYVIVPPAQPLPIVPYAQQAHQAAETADILAGFYDFEGDIGVGWYPSELDRLDSATYQHMAQTLATLTLSVGCAAPWTVDIAVLDSYIRPESPLIDLIIAGQPVSLTRERGTRRWIYRAQIDEGVAGDWALDIGVARLVRPSDIISDDDDRPLGAALDWVLITSPSCN